jgi:hypothetical protein
VTTLNSQIFVQKPNERSEQVQDISHLKKKINLRALLAHSLADNTDKQQELKIIKM